MDYHKNQGSSSNNLFGNFGREEKSAIMEYSNSTIGSNSNRYEDNWLDPNMMQILVDEGEREDRQGLDMQGVVDEFENDGLPILRAKESMFEYSSANQLDYQKDLMLRKTESVRTGGTNTSKDFSSEFTKNQ